MSVTKKFYVLQKKRSLFLKMFNVIISWLGGGRGLEGFGSVTVKFI